ncbi:MAG: hypothetical protein WC302_00245 [Candidatus Paceibacterota bacterium]|jgi:hypothetical protein
MKNKIAYIAVALILVLAGGYLTWDWLDQAEEVPVQEEEEVEIDLSVVAEEGFEVSVPLSWYKITPPEGIALYLVDSESVVTDPEKEKEEFRTYLAVTHGENGGLTLSELTDQIESFLKDLIDGEITFGGKQPMEIGGRNAIAVEALIVEGAYQYKTLLVSVEGEGDDAWTMSFNTTDVKWDDLKPVFYKAAETFKVKIADEETVQE